MSTLMIQGTSSDAGKSLVVTGLCRLLFRRGLRVAPFKPQNMALNSAVSVDGGEIGRAQALQALAAGVDAVTDFNPVLLKPCGERNSQVIIDGRAVGTMSAVEYHRYKPQAMQAVLAAWQRLRQGYDVVLVEGAGSPAEINLREQDIANMGFAEAVDCPVLLVADIDRGGVFAQLFGTLALLAPSEQQRVQGLLINKFRGDPALLQSGVDWVEKATAKPVLAVLDYVPDLLLDGEDSLTRSSRRNADAQLRIVIPNLPRLSNHTDFDVLRAHPQLELLFADRAEDLQGADLVILPGSKNVRSDMQWLEQGGWCDGIRRHLRYGGRLLGICGGFQMLGTTIRDPLGIEGEPGQCRGLGVLEMTTVLDEHKQLRNVSGRLTMASAPVSGYEIHAGISTGEALTRPAVRLGSVDDGAVSEDQRIIGTYVHGLFDRAEACAALLAWAGLADAGTVDLAARRERDIDRLADMMEQALDMDALLALFNRPRQDAAREGVV